MTEWPLHELSLENINPAGIAVHEGKIYVVDSSGVIYVSDSLTPTMSVSEWTTYELSSENENPIGIDVHEGKIYIVDKNSMIYISDSLTPDMSTTWSEYDLYFENDNPVDISVYEDRIYVVDELSGYIYRSHDLEPTLSTWDRYSLYIGNTGPVGISVYKDKDGEERIYVLDFEDNGIYRRDGLGLSEIVPTKIYEGGVYTGGENNDLKNALVQKKPLSATITLEENEYVYFVLSTDSTGFIKIGDVSLTKRNELRDDPGVIYVGGERIEYRRWYEDLDNNTYVLDGISRGTKVTAPGIPATYVTEIYDVYDDSGTQIDKHKLPVPRTNDTDLITDIFLKDTHVHIIDSYEYYTMKEITKGDGSTIKVEVRDRSVEEETFLKHGDDWVLDDSGEYIELINELNIGINEEIATSDEIDAGNPIRQIKIRITQFIYDWKYDYNVLHMRRAV